MTDVEGPKDTRASEGQNLGHDSAYEARIGVDSIDDLFEDVQRCDDLKRVGAGSSQKGCRIEAKPVGAASIEVIPLVVVEIDEARSRHGASLTYPAAVANRVFSSGVGASGQCLPLSLRAQIAMRKSSSASATP